MYFLTQEFPTNINQITCKSPRPNIIVLRRDFNHALELFKHFYA